MNPIGSYQLLETLHQTRHSVVYRGRREGDAHTVIIKYMRAKYPSSYEMFRFQQEYEIIRSLDIEGVIRTYEIINYDAGIALVLEDFDAVSLKELIREKPVELDRFFPIGIKIAQILGALHKKGVVHRDIKPGNILLSKDYQQVKVTDFGISQIVTYADEEIYNPEVIEGTLKYMSPEQTGRMNRAIDYRTDLYSLGVTFYEMLTGTTPFNYNDPLEIIHAHIAREVPPPDQAAAGIPKIISDIIHKLLIKPAEERYQNAFGLAHDLTLAWQQWREKGEVGDFELASNDISLKFNIPQQLVGRENETRLLLEAFERVGEGGIPEVLFVTGHPGVGKSFLVDELYKPILARKGYFVSGKFEQFRKDVPYSAIIQAFIKLVNQILVESNERIEAWKKRLQTALGDNAKVITDILPQLKAIIGEPADVPELGPEESENRFHYVFKNFLQVFAAFEHPLVLVLDDLQWADMASLNLIQQVFPVPDNGHFFFIGIYRDNEVNETHALTRVIGEIRASRIRMESVFIRPLDEDSVRRLLGKFLRQKSSDVASLAGIIYTKTHGNPFFINQFVKRLYEKNILEIDSSGKWQWDDQIVHDMEVTDNVVDLMVQKIREISPDAQEVLKVASCIGNRFDLKTMCIVQDKTPNQILGDMAEALEGGLVFFRHDMCHFLHDRIQEAAYSLIAEADRSRLHYKIGIYLYRNTDEQDLREKVFYIVNQLDAGASWIRDREEALEVARLNLLAGKKAKDSAAYQSAQTYFHAGIGLLKNSDWQENYSLTYELYLYAAEAGYLNADFSGMEDYLQAVQENCRALLDQAKAYEIRIQAYTAQNRLKDAVQATKNILSLLGLNFPRKIDKKRIAIELYKTKWCLRNMAREDFESHPLMQDPYSLAIIRIAASANAAFYAGGYVREITFVVLKMIRLTIRRGIAPQSPFYFSSLAMILHPLNQLEEAFQYADLALALREKLSLSEIRTKFIVYCYMLHWREHVRNILNLQMEIYHAGFEVGNVAYSLLTASQYGCFLFNCGKELTLVEQEIDRINGITRQYQMETAWNYNAIIHQVVHNLLGHAEDPRIISGEKCNISGLARRYEDVNDRLGLFFLHLYSAQLCYVFGDPEGAKKEIDGTRKYLDAGSGGLYHFSLYYFYRALIMLAGLEEMAPAKQKKVLKKVAYYNSKLKHFSKFAPMNFEHKYLLVCAEMARVQKDFLQAEELYEKAAEGAGKNEFLQEAALAYELAAHFFLQRDFASIAGLYFNQAVSCYARWGAAAKVEQIQSRHASLLANREQIPTGMVVPGNDTGDTSSSGSTMVDLYTFLKSSQAITGEIVLENLLEQLMKIGIENAGAEKGAMIFEKEAGLFIEALADVSGGIEALVSIPVEGYAGVPASVINYVLKTHENLVLGNACEDERFVRDPYIKENGVKSVLCAPIRKKSEVAAILYLENNLSTDAFTPERLELLRVISSQAAISIENARLFELARRDGLTELLNHRYFQYALQKELEAAGRNNHKVSLLMLDIDHFKDFNDTYGHQLGDAVLKEVATVLKQNAPDKDLAGRYGGEEFSVIIPRLPEDNARALAEQIRRETEEMSVKNNGDELKVTISIGMAIFPYDGATSAELIGAADKALYQSKETGRNRVTLYC